MPGALFLDNAALARVGGRFCKIAFADQVDVILARGMAGRPPARFNRPGQDALYLSPDAESARVAIGEYIGPGDPPRVLVWFEISACWLFDLRDERAMAVYELARQKWRAPLAEGHEPQPWHAADQVRQAGHPGLIDPSRRQPGLWHITLFNWNIAGAPEVRIIGDPVPIECAPGLGT